jgi:hypothetical protein
LQSYSCKVSPENTFGQGAKGRFIGRKVLGRALQRMFGMAIIFAEKNDDVRAIMNSGERE